jgi:hypothetical protein
MTKKKATRADELDKVMLAFFGLKYLRDQHPNPVHRHYLFQIDPVNDQSTTITKVDHVKPWMHSYLNNLEHDGVIKAVTSNDYVITDIKKIDVILSERKNYGAEILGWYLAPNRIAYPWEISKLDDENFLPPSGEDAANAILEEVLGREDEGEDKVDKDMIEASVAMPESRRTEVKHDTNPPDDDEVSTAAHELVLTMQKVNETLRLHTENNNAIKEELAKVKNKLNNIETKIARIESMTDKRNTADLELENRMINRIASSLGTTIQSSVMALQSNMETVKADTTSTKTEVHKIVEELNRYKEREAKFFYEFFSDLTAGLGDKGDGTPRS